MNTQKAKKRCFNSRTFLGQSDSLPFCQSLWRNQSFRRIDSGNPRLLNSIREIFGNPSGLRYTYLFAVGLNHHRNRASVISLQLLSSKPFADIIGSSGFCNALMNLRRDKIADLCKAHVDSYRSVIKPNCELNAVGDRLLLPKEVSSLLYHGIASPRFSNKFQEYQDSVKFKISESSTVQRGNQISRLL